MKKKYWEDTYGLGMTVSVQRIRTRPMSELVRSVLKSSSIGDFNLWLSLFEINYLIEGYTVCLKVWNDAYEPLIYKTYVIYGYIFN